MKPCIAELDVTAENFILAETLAAFPDRVAELGLAVPQEENITAYLRIDGPDLTASQSQVHLEETNQTIQYIEAMGSRGLYRVEWIPDAENPFSGVIPDEAQILYAIGQTDRWEMTVQFASLDACERFQEKATDCGGGVELNQLYQNPGRADLELTPPQRAAVEVAYELGYFEVPRAVSMRELAEELGVTQNAVSERLRRAQRRVFAWLLTAESD